MHWPGEGSYWEGWGNRKYPGWYSTDPSTINRNKKQWSWSPFFCVFYCGCYFPGNYRRTKDHSWLRKRWDQNNIQNTSQDGSQGTVTLEDKQSFSHPAPHSCLLALAQALHGDAHWEARGLAAHSLSSVWTVPLFPPSSISSCFSLHCTVGNSWGGPPQLHTVANELYWPPHLILPAAPGGRY